MKHEPAANHASLDTVMHVIFGAILMVSVGLMALWPEVQGVLS